MTRVARHASGTLMWVALVSALAPCELARATQSAVLRVVVRVTGEADRRLVSRLRGQLSDVPVELHTVATEAPESSFADQLRKAEELAANADTMVVWFRFQGTRDGEQHLWAHVATPQMERVFTRHLRAPAPRGSIGAGLLESAALVVRSAVKALLEGGDIGVRRDEALEDMGQAPSTTTTESVPSSATGASSEGGKGTGTRKSDTTTHVARGGDIADETTEESRAAEATSAGASSRSSERSAPDAPPRDGTTSDDLAPKRSDTNRGSPPPERHAETSAPVHLRSYVGWQAVFDGESEVGQHGVNAQLGMAIDRWVLMVRGSLSIPAVIEDEWARLHVARHSFGAMAGWQPPTNGPFRLLLAVHGEAVFFRRSTEPKVNMLEPTPPATTVSFGLGGELHVMWMPGAVGVGVQVGLDVLPNPPRYELRTDTDEGSKAHRLWVVQPRVSLGLEVQLS